MRLDGYSDDALIATLCARLADISEDELPLISTQFEGDQSEQFYQGMLAGFTSSYAWLTRPMADEQPMPKEVVIRAIAIAMSYSAKLAYEKKHYTEDTNK